MTIIAVDPGANGAIAVRKNGGQIAVHDMPETRGDVYSLLSGIVSGDDRAMAYVEKISPYIPGGGASQMFEFGRNVERVLCILHCLRVPIIEIAPQKWQKELGLGKSGRKPPPKMPRGLSREQARLWKSHHEDEIRDADRHNAKAKREWKMKLKACAEQLFPGVKVTLANCDALLILAFAARATKNPI